MKLITSFIQLIERMTRPQSINPDTAIMEYMTRMMLIFLSFTSVPLSLFSIAGWTRGIVPPDTLIILLFMNVVFITGLWFAQIGYWRAGSMIPPAVMFLSAVYGNYIGGIDAPAMLLYVLSILLFSILRGKRDMYVAIFISLGTYIGLGLAHRNGYITQIRSAETAFWNRVLITCGAIICISTLVRFLIIQFRKSLKQAQQEIAERKLAEEALRDSEKNYRELVQNANSIIIRLNMKGEVIFWNEYAENFFGFSRESIIGKNVVGTIVPETDSSGRNLNLMIEEIILSPENFTSNENENITKDGRRVWIAWANRSITDRQGRVTELLCVGNDITDRKRAMEEKERIQAQLVHAQKMEAIGTLTSGLAHDFNNMLSGIMGSLSLLELLVKNSEFPSREKSEKYIQMAIGSSKRASDMINQLLLLSRKQDITLEPVDINLCMQHVIDICRNSFPKSVIIDAVYGDSPMAAMADAILIEQIFLNFCVNASHAMTIMRGTGEKDGGNLQIRISDEERITAENPETGEAGITAPFIRIDIADTGIGMDEETRKRIFEPFFTMKKKGTGTGLGLSMAYGFINQLGGFIEIESETDRGSTFSIFLPMINPMSLETRPMEKSRTSLVRGNGTILVIDDEADVLSVAKDTLTSSGYTVLTSGSSIEGLSVYENSHENIDAVLLDISMPHMSGLEVFRKFLEINSSVRVLISSGYSEDERIAHAMELGAAGFIPKPYVAEELSWKMHEILNSPGTGA